MKPIDNWPWVEEQVARVVDVWSDCAAPGLSAGPQFSSGDQRKREKAYDEGLRAVEREAKKAARTPAERFQSQQRIVAAFPRFAAIALGLDDAASRLLTHGFLPPATQLARWTRRFDPALSRADTIQACRNVWTACGLQPLLGDPMGITPSILGYSLLYPYSDNYLDDEQVTGAEKRQFNARFRDRLRGLSLAPLNPREAAVWTMVEFIEDEFPRAAYPQVYESLLAIHRAQEASMAQLRASGPCGAAEVLRISCAKGGTSVVADACLSHGSLSDEESRLTFDWGVSLQLGDDLQDVREDLKRGSATLFTRAAAAGKPLDSLAIQLLNFSGRVAEGMDRLPHGPASHKALLHSSWRSLILMAVADAQELFTPDFLADLERTSPFRFSFLRARRHKYTGRKGLYDALFDAFVEAGEGDLDRLPSPAGRLEFEFEAKAVPLPELLAIGSAGA
jgi:hypothetical protein